MWIAFPDKRTYLNDTPDIAEAMDGRPGADTVCIFLRAGRQIKRLPVTVNASEEFLDILRGRFGVENVKVR